jgi:hypothetical protein
MNFGVQEFNRPNLRCFAAGGKCVQACRQPSMAVIVSDSPHIGRRQNDCSSTSRRHGHDTTSTGYALPVIAESLTATSTVQTTYHDRPAIYRQRWPEHYYYVCFRDSFRIDMAQRDLVILLP